MSNWYSLWLEMAVKSILNFYIFLKFSSHIHSLQVVGGNLLPEAVTWFFTSVLRGLQVHGQHEVCNSTLSQLAMLIYENLVRLIAIIFSICVLYFCRCLVYFLWLIAAGEFIFLSIKCQEIVKMPKVTFSLDNASLFVSLLVPTSVCPSVLAASLQGAESSDDPDPKHQCGRSGPVRSQAHGPHCPEGWRQEEKRPVQEAHCRNCWGNTIFRH